LFLLISYKNLLIFLLVWSITKCVIGNYTHNVNVVLQIRKNMQVLDKMRKVAFQMKHKNPLLFKENS
jgi:hypothetical protein